jgi:DNA adenine methylase Dam
MNYIKSPLNYTGGKYKLLPQLLTVFPKEFKNFYDLFSGGLNVCLNINSNKIIANDYNKQIIELYEYFKSKSYEDILKEIELIIKKYKLSDTSKNGYEFYGCTSADGVGKYNKERYIKLREDYNKKPTPIKFFTLIVYCFNHQIRFNNKGEFNLPVGKRDLNNSIKNNLKNFINRINELNIIFYHKDYKEIEIEENSFIYLDPPYLVSTASYNENGGWNEEKEIELLSYIDLMSLNGNKFALSNVFENKGRRNEILIEWSKRYNVHYLTHSYSNSNYQSKNRDNKTIEVLITNF